MPVEIKEIVIKANIEIVPDTSKTHEPNTSAIDIGMANMQELIDGAMKSIKDKSER